MRRRIALLLALSASFAARAPATEPPTEAQRRSKYPPNGLVPNAETAIRIAVAVWEPIYGKEEIQGQRPFRAALKNGIWTVRGSLPQGYVGGVAEAEIAQSDARVLKVAHGK